MLLRACRRGSAVLTVGLVVGLAAAGTAGADAPVANRYKPPGPPYVQLADHSICSNYSGRPSDCTWYFHLDITYNGRTTWQYAHEAPQPDCNGSTVAEGHGTDSLKARFTAAAEYSRGAVKQFLIYSGNKQALTELR